MNPIAFQALVVQEDENGDFTRQVQSRSTADLPDGDLLIQVKYSSLNYKDALSASGNRGVTRTYPHTPGIDAAGTVVESQDAAFAPDDEVIVIGYDLGMNTAGGFGQYIRVPANWVVKRPPALSLRESMIYGTAGYTAAMCVQRLIAYGIEAEQGEILVTGATGGVGSVAVALLAQAGYQVTAATGKTEQTEFLHELGASNVIARSELHDESNRPMLRSRWAGAVDTVGGEILATVLKSTQYGAAVACCGLVASADLPTTVLPFILRGVTLIGIDSVNCALASRPPIWQKLAGEWKLDQLERLATPCTLADLDAHLTRILAGEQVGRILVDLWA